MKTKKTFKWNVRPSTTPLYKRKCNKCNRIMPYYCSEKFRINSQRKTLDVWMIYKCEKCDTTSNIEILSRVNPQFIDKEKYDKFQCNDVETAWKYAFDPEIIKSNKIEADYSNIEYDITGDILSLEEIANQFENLIEFEIGVQYHLNLKLTYIIRQAFNISLSQLEQMLSLGVIQVLPLGQVKKRKLKDKVKLIVNSDKLKIFLAKQSVNRYENEISVNKYENEISVNE